MSGVEKLTAEPIQRWALTASHNIYGVHRIIEDPDDAGEWVKFYDVRSALATLQDEKEKLEKENEALRAALEDAEDTLKLVEQPAFLDPVHGDEIDRLGRRMGFGALMSSASAAWRAYLLSSGYPTGGEFVAGPCLGTVVSTLAKIRAARPQEDPAWAVGARQIASKSLASMMPLDAKGLAAATSAVTKQINLYWQDDSVEPGHEPVAEAAVRAYLAARALSTSTPSGGDHG